MRWVLFGAMWLALLVVAAIEVLAEVCRPEPPAPGEQTWGPEEGQARCFRGVVEVARRDRGWRWARAGSCPRGCVAEGGFETVSRDIATTQLCAPSPGESFWTVDHRPVSVGAGCEVEAFRCVDGLVVECDGGEGDAIAACRHGCAVPYVFRREHGGGAAAEVICARGPRDRRALPSPGG